MTWLRTLYTLADRLFVVGSVRNHHHRVGWKER
jgi:hypothetical protein